MFRCLHVSFGLEYLILQEYACFMLILDTVLENQIIEQF
jgi:hypothetical protein